MAAATARQTGVASWRLLWRAVGTPARPAAAAAAAARGPTAAAAVAPAGGLVRFHGTARTPHPPNGPALADFMKPKGKGVDLKDVRATEVPYLDSPSGTGAGQTVYFETYGCQMNTNDTEIVWALLQQQGYRRTDVVEDANVILLVTCAVRDNAEKKIWNRLDTLRRLKRPQGANVRIGVLGCMAERLKTKLLEADKLVDVVCGPDAYRDLPRLLADVRDSDQPGVNVMLSLEETYADITPVRLNADSVSAFVSVMRGCDNMCSFCIVPFTRGRERSRPIDSVVDEVRQLAAQNVREITLLGQNVNSYRDLSHGADAQSYTMLPLAAGGSTGMSRGFTTIYRKREGGLRFADLLDRLSAAAPEVRFRFTSPHPKDFPDELLALMKERPNICKNIHLPAQSGSTTMLQRMRRGYTREAYLELVQRIREFLPTVALSSDFITGFCGETEEEHRDTVSLLEAVRYDMAYMFAYSMREKTHAHRNYTDDVPADVKQRRLAEIISTFQRIATEKAAELVGTLQLVLVEGSSRRAPGQDLAGRADCGRRVFFPAVPVARQASAGASAVSVPVPGDYVWVRIQHSTSQSLRGRAVARAAGLSSPPPATDLASTSPAVAAV